MPTQKNEFPTWKTEFIETKRGRFEVFVTGSGSPVCVTHLYSQFNDSGDRFANAFAEDHQVFLVNLKGAGHSDRVQEESEYGLLNSALDLDAVRESLGLPTWTFAGHSTGGMVGLFYAVHAGQGLDGLVLAGTGANFYWSTPDCIYSREHPQYQVMQDILNTLQYAEPTVEERRRLSRERTQLSLHRPERYDDYFDGSISKTMSVAHLNYFVRSEMNKLDADLRARLREVDTRTLILCGEHDVQCPPRYSRELHELLPNAELVLFPESNHYPFLEEKEAFQAALRAFFH